MEREAILNFLQHLYKLRDEGKNVDTLITQYEEMLFKGTLKGVYYSIEQDDFNYEGTGE